MRFDRKRLLGFVGIIVLVFGCASAAVAQAPAAPAAPPPSDAALKAVTGVWDGVAQGPNGDVSLHVELAVQDGKLGGFIDSSMGRIAILSAALTEDRLTMTIDVQGAAGTLTGKVQGPKVDGMWEVGGQSGPFTLNRPGAAAVAAPAGDPLTGVWSGEVAMAGQVIPFTMTVKVAGEAVSGDIGSDAGKAPITSGTWKGGTLTIAFTYVDGAAIGLAGQITDGKLSGVIDYNKGEMSGTWAASKK